MQKQNQEGKNTAKMYKKKTTKGAKTELRM